MSQIQALVSDREIYSILTDDTPSLSYVELACAIYRTDVPSRSQLSAVSRGVRRLVERGLVHCERSEDARRTLVMPPAYARRAAALAALTAQPGITIPEIAEQTGMKQNYLYRVLPGLAEDGLVRRDGRGWYPTHI